MKSGPPWLAASGPSTRRDSPGGRGKRGRVRADVASRTLHDFRRTAAHNDVRSGVPETVILKILGHRTRSILDCDNVTSEGDLQAAAEQVAAPVKEGVGKLVALPTNAAPDGAGVGQPSP